MLAKWFGIKWGAVQELLEGVSQTARGMLSNASFETPAGLRRVVGDQRLFRVFRAGTAVVMIFKILEQPQRCLSYPLPSLLFFCAVKLYSACRAHATLLAD